MQSSYMSFNADATYPGRQSIGDDDEIISGEQKMSPKSPVSPIGVDLADGPYSVHVSLGRAGSVFTARSE